MLAEFALGNTPDDELDDITTAELVLIAEVEDASAGLIDKLG